MRRAVTRTVPGLLACLTLAAFSIGARGDMIFNQEPNNTFSTAQVIPRSDFTLDFNANIGTGGGGGFVNTSTVLPHVTVLRPGTAESSANLDFFRFTLPQQGVIVLDIDDTPVPTTFDTVLHLFNGSGVLLATNDNAVATGPGDGSGLIGGLLNSRIETGILPAGDYIVAVAQSPSFGSDGGGVTDPIPAFSSYTLNISVSPIAVPEPSTMALLGIGTAGLIGYRNRRGRKRA
jgi:hypothetical protein